MCYILHRVAILGKNATLKFLFKNTEEHYILNSSSIYYNYRNTLIVVFKSIREGVLYIA